MPSDKCNSIMAKARSLIYFSRQFVSVHFIAESSKILYTCLSADVTRYAKIGHVAQTTYLMSLNKKYRKQYSVTVIKTNNCKQRLKFFTIL